MQSGAKCSILGTRHEKGGRLNHPGQGLSPKKPVQQPSFQNQQGFLWQEGADRIWPFIAFDSDMVSVPGIRASVSLFYF